MAEQKIRVFLKKILKSFYNAKKPPIPVGSGGV